MNRDIAIVFERGDAAALASLAGRVLAEHALGRHARILFRLGAVVWARPETTWPEPGPELAAWLAHQECPGLAAYWRMVVDCCSPSLAGCATSLAAAELQTPPGWASLGLVGFLSEAIEDGAEVAWLV